MQKNKHLPTKLIQYDKYKYTKLKWVTFGNTNQRKSLEKILKKADPTSVEFAVFQINLNIYNKILKNDIRFAVSIVVCCDVTTSTSTLSYHLVSFSWDLSEITTGWWRNPAFVIIWRVNQDFNSKS